jgi:purine catabolism regulator
MPEEEQFALAQRLATRVHRSTGPGLRFGVGRPVAGSEARRSFHEARCAVEALAFGVAADGRHNNANHNANANGTGTGTGNGNGTSGGSVAVANYQDLGSFQLLLSLQDDDALKLFCDSILGPIEASEGHYGGELMRSLEAFIEENGQWERAARRLYCHRHTLRYRIKRVEELTGRNLHSARDRIDFWLALRGRELVG